jgi:hypothetical protein
MKCVFYLETNEFQSGICVISEFLFVLGACFCFEFARVESGRNGKSPEGAEQSFP